MGTYLRRTPALLDVLGCLLAQDSVWGLQVVKECGRPTGTVYPILERLERELFLRSRWDTVSDRPGPRRRVYELTTEGQTWAREQLKGTRPTKVVG